MTPSPALQRAAAYLQRLAPASPRILLNVAAVLQALQQAAVPPAWHAEEEPPEADGDL